MNTSHNGQRSLPFSGSFVAAVVLGLGGAKVSNAWWGAKSEIRRAIQDHGGDLRVFLHEAARNGVPVSLTMKNRKVYVGLVMRAPGLQEPSYVRLLPTVSGYREERTLRLVFSTPYEHVYEDLERRQAAGEKLAVDISSFVIILPLENIDSANQFDIDVYARHFAGAPGVGRPSPPPAGATPPS